MRRERPELRDQLPLQVRNDARLLNEARKRTAGSVTVAAKNGNHVRTSLEVPKVEIGLPWNLDNKR